MADQTRVHY